MSRGKADLIKFKMSTTYVFVRILYCLLDFSEQSLEYTELISLGRQSQVVPGVEQIAEEPGLDAVVPEERLGWPGEKIRLEKLEVLAAKEK